MKLFEPDQHNSCGGIAYVYQKKNLLLLPLLFSIFIFSKNIEEVVVKGEYREKSISEEDSSISIMPW